MIRRSVNLLALLILVAWIAVAARYAARPATLKQLAPVATGWRVDVNDADEAELSLLPGIGPTTARRIVTFRSGHASFARPADLADVPGIGPKTVARIRPWIRFE